MTVYNCGTQYSTEQFFTFILQTIITAQMTSIGGEGGTDRYVKDRVRTILVLGNWVLGNIYRYWVVLLLGDICYHCDTQYDTDQTTVSTVYSVVASPSVWNVLPDSLKRSRADFRHFQASTEDLLLHVILDVLVC